SRYAERTDWNVRDSDATLILTIGDPRGGTAFTARSAARRGKPCLVIDLSSELDGAVEKTRSWIAQHGVRTLNVAGPRESQRPGIRRRAKSFLGELLSRGGHAPSPHVSPGRYCGGR